MQRERVGIGLLWAAAAVGLVHAAFSLYWAAGGRWLLRTVGSWAVQLADSRPLAVAAVLGLVTAVKIAGALLPVVVQTRPVRGRRQWRLLFWAGSVILVLYGLANVVIGWAVLGGLFVPDGGYDSSALIGHAALWDPLFLLWGLVLAAGLRLTQVSVIRRPA